MRTVDAAHIHELLQQHGLALDVVLQRRGIVEQLARNIVQRRRASAARFTAFKVRKNFGETTCCDSESAARRSGFPAHHCSAAVGSSKPIEKDWPEPARR